MFVEHRSFNFISASEKENVLTIVAQLVPELRFGVELVRHSNKGDKNLHDLFESKLAQFPLDYTDILEEDRGLCLGFTALKILNMGCAQACGITTVKLIRNAYRQTKDESFLDLIDKVESMLPPQPTCSKLP